MEDNSLAHFSWDASHTSYFAIAAWKASMLDRSPMDQSDLDSFSKYIVRESDAQQYNESEHLRRDERRNDTIQTETQLTQIQSRTQRHH